jgi:hypothetical protein
MKIRTIIDLKEYPKGTVLEVIGRPYPIWGERAVRVKETDNGFSCLFLKHQCQIICKCGHDYAAHFNGNVPEDTACFYNCGCNKYEE